MAKRSLQISKSPDWVKVFSVFILLYGVSLLVSNIKGVSSGSELSHLENETQKKWEEQRDVITSDTIFPDSVLNYIEPIEIFDSLAHKTIGKSIFHVSHKTKEWQILFSKLGIVFSLVLLLMGVVIFLPSMRVIYFGYAVLVLSILFKIFQGYVFVSGDSIVSLFSGIGKFFMIIVDVGFLIFLSVANKNFYKGITGEYIDEDLDEFGV